MNIIPSTWIKSCSLRTDFKKISNLAIVLVITFLCLPFVLSACVVSCKSNLNVSLDGNGQALITPLILLQDPSCNQADFTVDITDPNGISIGNTLSCEHVDLTMTATVTQISNGNSCQTLIVVKDYIKPQISCEDVVILCNQSAHPDDIGYPTVTDNCSVFDNNDLNYTDEFMNLGCFEVQGNDTITSQIQRTWTVQDENGNNSNACIQMIYLKRVTIDDVTFPPHRDGFAAPALDCTQDPTDLTLTGVPTINGIPIDNNGDCELIVSHSDQIVPLCSPDSYRVLRTWTIIDYCSDDFTLKIQIINVSDKTAPVINCPSDVTVGTLQNDCTATLTLPTASATDDCSEFTITPSWSFGTGYGPFTDIPVGTHPVTYTAEDDCGNKSTCIINVTVVDNIPPTTVCVYSNSVNLTAFGNALVYANSYNNGSHDNCGINNYKISRDGINFGSSVSFNCEDVENSPIEVILKVWDTNGNINECIINTYVNDEIDPAIICPNSITINCNENYNDLDIVGIPVMEDNCEIDTFYYVDVINIDDCNEGTVTRTWTVRDVGGNTNSCVQIITLEDNAALNIIWPENYSTSICGDYPDINTAGEPILQNDACKSISMTHEDETIYTSSSCYKIFRTWSVYEWCIYNPNSGSNEGLWNHVQVIDIEDNTAPSLVCAEDTIVNMYAADCSGVFVNLAAPSVTDCNPDVEINNDSPFADNDGANASGIYPPGTHTIKYTATDGCGNFTLCTRKVTVVDAKAPVAYCLSGINLNIGMDGTLSISPEMINNGSYDNCTADQDLTFTVSPNYFTCDDLGSQTVMLTVIDEAGNMATCSSTINIQNNNNICSTPSARIGGYIVNVNGAPIEKVDVQLTGSDQDITTNNNTGYFEFPEVPLYGNYEIKPVKDIFHLNGVSTIDMVHMQRHVLGIQEIASPYHKIAADINNSGGISTIDLVKLRKLILQIDISFADVESWRFIEEAFVFPDPSNPFASSFPESIVVNGLTEDYLSADFIGVKMGDVNGSANPTQLNENGDADSRNADQMINLNTRGLSFSKDQMLEVPIFAEDFDDILGCQFTIEFDESVLAFSNIGQGSLEDLNTENFNFSKTEEGLIWMSWTRPVEEVLDPDEPLFTLKFDCLKNGDLENNFNINSQILNAEAYSSQLEILGINFEFSSLEDAKREQFMLSQNYPNPFEEHTTIPFFIPQSDWLRFEVFDAKGRLVKRFEKHYEAGHQEIEWERNEFGASGIYFVQLSLSNGERQTRPMIVK